MILCISSVNALAANFSYSTSTLKEYDMIVNASTATETLAVNTRPTEGKGGALVKLVNSNGTTVTKVFPYYVFVDDLTTSMAPNGVVRTYIGPKTTGETVTGTLTFDML